MTRYTKLIHRILPEQKPMAIRARANAFEEELERDLVKALRPGGMASATPLRLLVPPDLADEPWEARLAAPAVIMNRDWSPYGAALMWRRAPGRRPEPPKWMEPFLTATLHAQTWSPFVDRSWMPLLPAEAAEDVAVPIREGCRAVLVIGSPLATGGGWRIRIEDFHGPLRTSKDDEFDNDLIIEPEVARVARPLVVAMAPPAGEAPTLDRRTADGLRGFADEAFAAGAHAAITIPPLPPPLAQDLVSAIARALNEWHKPPSTQALIDLTTNLRQQVFGWSPPPHEEAERRERVQVALDICLYAGSDED